MLTITNCLSPKLICLILFWSIIPQVYLQSCLSFPSNSSAIFNSAVLPNDAAGINGFQVFDVDGMTYPYTQNGFTGNESFQCTPNINVINCGPIYACCFTIVSVVVDPSIENNWVVSNYYQTEAEVIQIQISCKPLQASPISDCRSAFYIYYYESDASVSDISTVLHQFSPATLSINQTFNDRLVYATFNKEKGGFYIGFFNNGTCSEINTFQIYYNICPSLTTSEMSSVPETPVPRLSQPPTQVNISCPPGSLSRNRAECYSNSNWVLYPCECVAGWRQLSNLSCAACPVNSYKEFVGNERECVTCPSQSSTDGNTGSVMCGCGAGFYRGEGESVSMECGRSPSAVRNIRVERYSVERAMLRVLWDEPVEVFNRSVSFNLSLYTRESDRDVLRWNGISVDLWRNLSESELEESREYVLIVTPLNNLVELSGMENCENISFLSTFPLLRNFSLVRNNSIFEFVYELKGGVSELSFELNYTINGSAMMQAAVNGCSLVSGDTYLCRVTVNNFNQSENFVLTLITFSSVETNAFSDVFNLMMIGTTTPQTSSSSNVTSIRTNTTNSPNQNSPVSGLDIIVYIIPIVLILLIVVIGFAVGICICLYLKKRRSNPTVYKKEQNFPLEKLYQDPGLYNDLNTAVRRFAKDIDHQDLEFGDSVGEGEFADVCRGHLKKQEQQITVAIKILKPSASKKNKEDFFREASIMGQFKHPNVIFLYGVTLIKPIVIVTPFMENGSLDDFVRRNEASLTAIQQATICMGVSCGMAYFTKIGFVHRDLASRNVLIDRDWTPKITDFGLSRETEENFYNVKSGGKIPIRWTAPEAIAYRKFNESSDVWSFGVLMWEVMSFGRLPYSGIENFNVLAEVQAGYRLERPDFCPEPMYEHILSCWKSDYNDRPTFNELKNRLTMLIDNNFGNKNKRRSSRLSMVIQNLSIEAWLESLKLPRYIPIFQDAGYCYITQVYSISNETLMSIGVVPLSHRHKILKSLSDMYKAVQHQVGQL